LYAVDPVRYRRQLAVAGYGSPMGKGKKADVQFILPEAAPEFEDLAIEDEDEFEEPPYTSIEHSVASGEG
jgi:hypothetical protein